MPLLRHEQGAEVHRCHVLSRKLLRGSVLLTTLSLLLCRGNWVTRTFLTYFFIVLSHGSFLAAKLSNLANFRPFASNLLFSSDQQKYWIISTGSFLMLSSFLSFKNSHSCVSLGGGSTITSLKVYNYTCVFLYRYTRNTKMYTNLGNTEYLHIHRILQYRI